MNNETTTEETFPTTTKTNAVLLVAVAVTAVGAYLLHRKALKDVAKNAILVDTIIED